MYHQGTITISLKNTIIYVYVYVKGFTLKFIYLQTSASAGKGVQMIST
jgi:hypothetical protein